MEIRDLSALNQVQSAQKKEMSPRAKKILMEMKGFVPQCKAVTQKDTDAALLNPSMVRAVKGLLEKSPVGMTLQDSFEGYFPITMTDEYGGEYFENVNGGRISVNSYEIHPGIKFVEYTSKDGKYVQNMSYDEETGKFIGGSIEILDEFGNREKRFGIGMKNDGKMLVTTINPETGRVEEEVE